MRSNSRKNVSNGEQIQGGTSHQQSQRKKHEYNKQKFWGTIKKPNLRIHRVEGVKVQTKAIGNLFTKTEAGNFPNLGYNIDISIQEAFRAPSRHDLQRAIPCHILIKMQN
jgi:hypothetical protein